MTEVPADSESGAGNRSLGTGAVPAGFSAREDEAGRNYGRETQAGVGTQAGVETQAGTGVETQVQGGRGTKRYVRANELDQDGSPPSWAFVAVLILILDLIGVLQSPFPGQGDGSTRFRLGHNIVFDANVIATALSLLAVVMFLFGGTSPSAGPFKSLFLLSAAFITMLSLVSSVFFTWLQHSCPLLHMSFVGAVVAVSISASYYCRPGRCYK